MAVLLVFVTVDSPSGDWGWSGGNIKQSPALPPPPPPPPSERVIPGGCCPGIMPGMLVGAPESDTGGWAAVGGC